MATNPNILNMDPASYQRLIQQYGQMQQEQGAEAAPPSQPPPPPALPEPPKVPRRPFRPSISGGNLVHSRPFEHIGKRK